VERGKEFIVPKRPVRVKKYNKGTRFKMNKKKNVITTHKLYAFSPSNKLDAYTWSILDRYSFCIATTPQQAVQFFLDAVEKNIRPNSKVLFERADLERKIIYLTGRNKDGQDKEIRIYWGSYPLKEEIIPVWRIWR